MNIQQGKIQALQIAHTYRFVLNCLMMASTPRRNFTTKQKFKTAYRASLGRFPSALPGAEVVITSWIPSRDVR